MLPQICRNKLSVPVLRKLQCSVKLFPNCLPFGQRPLRRIHGFSGINLYQIIIYNDFIYKFYSVSSFSQVLSVHWQGPVLYTEHFSFNKIGTSLIERMSDRVIS